MTIDRDRIARALCSGRFNVLLAWVAVVCVITGCASTQAAQTDAAATQADVNEWLARVIAAGEPANELERAMRA